MKHQRPQDLPLEGFAIIVDGHAKTTFSTREGAHRAAIELKDRFPAIQINVYDAAARSAEICLIICRGRSFQFEAASR